jgi:hypothetical protein
MPMVTVELTDAEIELCERVAEARMAFGAANGLNHACIMDRIFTEREQHEFGGAAGELAVAKWFGVRGYQPSVQYVKGAVDVEPDIEVRSTGWMNGQLVVRPRDHGDRRYVLAITSLAKSYGQVRLAGWMWGHEARRDEFLQTYYKQPEHWVPRDALNPMHTMQRESNGTV